MTAPRSFRFSSNFIEPFRADASSSSGIVLELTKAKKSETSSATAPAADGLTWNNFHPMRRSSILSTGFGRISNATVSPIFVLPTFKSSLDTLIPSSPSSALAPTSLNRHSVT